MDDENRNGRAAEFYDETQQDKPEEQREPVNQGPQAYETTQYEATRVTPVVDNWAGGVDNSPSFWEEASGREHAGGLGREAPPEEDAAGRRSTPAGGGTPPGARRRAERERRTWWDRGPPEE